MNTGRVAACLFLLVIQAAWASPEDDRQKFEQAIATAGQAWSRGDWSGVRSALVPIVAGKSLPPAWRSIAHLRSASSLVAEQSFESALRELGLIASQTDYPAVHRYEAALLQAEAQRLLKQLPARDPELSRVRIPPAPLPGRTLHVAPGGSPDGDGSKERPFGSLEKAVEVVGGMGKVAGGTLILLAPGKYPVAKTIQLANQHSGMAESPLVIRAERPGQSVLYGGVVLGGFQVVSDPSILERLPAEARGKVMQCDLKALGITDYGKLAVRGWGQEPSPPTLELFADGKPQTLARWPNEGFTKAGKLVDPGQLNDPSVFNYVDTRHERWINAPDGWLFGYFRYLWADCTLPVGKIDPTKKTLSTVGRYNYGMSEEQGIIYYAFNLLEEIDKPGEWYLDRAKGMLYWYPPANPASTRVEVSRLPETMLSGRGVNHLRIEGLVFDCARYNGLDFQDCSDLVVTGCTVRRMAGNGITVKGGFRNRVVGCDIHTIGPRGTEIIGGDRPTLTPGNHVIANCRIRDYSRIDRTYTPGVQLEGVGNRVAHCLFENSPSSAMRIEGNDHLIEFNEFRRVVLESDDQGAIDIFTTPTYRGIVFRHNAFIDIGDGTGQHAGQGAIRFDDAISGMTVYGNVFLRAGRRFGAIQINCGRDNIIDNNLFIDCPIAVSGGYAGWNPAWKNNQSTNPPPEFILNDLYRSRYPELTRMFEPPFLNYLWRNAIIRCGKELSWGPESYDRVANAIRAEDPGFLKGQDLSRRPASDLFGPLGLRPIPMDEIGLYIDNNNQEQLTKENK